jgi:hypothetical protein
MKLPNKSDLLYCYSPTEKERATNRSLADEYAVYEHREMACGIAAYERHGQDWIGACALRPVLARVLQELRKARMARAAE